MNLRPTFSPSFRACLVLLLFPCCARAELLGKGMGELARIDEATAQGVRMGHTGGYGVGPMAVSPWGTVYFVGVNYLSDESFLGTIDPATGAVSQGPTLSGSIRWRQDVFGLDFSADSTLFAIQNWGTNDRLHRIDVPTGIATLVGSTGLKGALALAFSPDGMLYGWDHGVSGAGALGLVSIDPLTGLATDVNPTVGETDEILALAFAPDGTLYGAFTNLYTVDAHTGELTLVAPIEVPPHSFFATHAMVWIPEPSTLAGLLSLAATALLVYLLQRRRGAVLT